ncbi:MAG: hypothetical protein D3908_04965 [Candidatus Electrothrix sp. AUS4]|nr:hypothetical protein [Candidatus Electrothrix sp. AUS4]
MILSGYYLVTKKVSDRRIVALRSIGIILGNYEEGESEMRCICQSGDNFLYLALRREVDCRGREHRINLANLPRRF